MAKQDLAFAIPAKHVHTEQTSWSVLYSVSGNANCTTYVPGLVKLSIRVHSQTFDELTAVASSSDDSVLHPRSVLSMLSKQNSNTGCLIRAT